MSFNLFGPATKNSIKVGYISTERGFVDGVTVCEANDYAKLNPGVRFIFRTRDSIRYLGINDINNLSPNDLASSEGECPGIKLDVDCGPAQVFFYGGGGVGVLGNPVIGADGSVLAVDIISGGFGYQYPPIVEVKDNCGIGAGAVLRTIIGEIVETLEVYDQEEDFEEYELCDPSDVGYGRRYGPNGEDLGPWEPSVYANIDEDPIRREIKTYQDFLASLRGGFRINKNDNIIHNWWTTRKEPPLRLTSANKVTRTKFDVDDKTHVEYYKTVEKRADFTAWNDFMNSYAISPVPPSNVKGSDFGAFLYTFEWEEDFPYDGEYVFRGCADGEIKELYFDNVKVGTLGSYNNSPASFKKSIKAGVHRIRLDLRNGLVGGSASSKSRNVFNTLNFIDKSDRRLWRTFPSVGKDGDFIHQYGVTPFDPNTPEANTDSFAGVHTIVWDNINFPTNGNYTIELMVDDNVTLYIDNGVGDEVIIRKRGFSSPSKSTGKTTETKFFKSGKYKIRAELEQLRGKPLAQGNPMALAININSSSPGGQIISEKSWNQNPMGVALTIDAPLPPVPQEPVIQQEGRCPRNPIWTTRFPGASERWYPVRYGEGWSRFMNRYAVSPVIPLSSPGTDAGGVSFKNSWTVDIPYDGFYGFRGTVDNEGKILIDGKEILRGSGLNFRGKTIGNSGMDGFRVENPQTTKVFLTRGSHRIEVEVQNRKIESFTSSVVNQKIFRTKDWAKNSSSEILSNKDGVVYEGPELFNYKNPDGTWHPFMNNASLSPVIPGPNADSDGRKRFKWKNIKFPVTGQYEINFLADNDAKLILGGKQILKSQGFGETPNSYFINISAGTYDLVIDSEYPYNNSENNTREYFETENPTGFAVVIKKDIEVKTPIPGRSWTENPVGISAVLIPPPCPKRVRGRGVVVDVEVDDPGNGYPIPQGDAYPVALRLKSVVVENPGINYNCGVDQIQITPSNGAVLDYECDSFGRINNVKIQNPGLGFTRYPEITILSETGVNATFRPQFEVVRDPIVVDPERLIQVTDLVGLKQTGYVDGRAYFGAVFYKEGVRYAGFYETPGDLVQVYDTLQESIDAQVTTRPSAILRQGTDVNSNNSRLNLPGTPDNLI